MNEQRIWRWSLVACASLIGVALFNLGQPTAEARRPPASDKCCPAVLDLNGVLTTLDERTVRERELNEYIQVQTTKLEALKKQAEQAQADLKVLPERSKDWETKREEAVILAINLEGAEKVAKGLVEDKRKRMSIDLFTKIKDAASRFAEKEGYAFVINSDFSVEIPPDMPEQQVQNAMVSRRLLYRAESTDISQAVAQMMNTEFKAR